MEKRSTDDAITWTIKYLNAASADNWFFLLIIRAIIDNRLIQGLFTFQIWNMMKLLVSSYYKDLTIKGIGVG